MAESLVPILKVADIARSAEWYARLGFKHDFEYRYSDDFPGYAGLKRGDLCLHLSEHPGDATPDTLLYFWVDDLAPFVAEFKADVIEQEWAREIHLADPDGNRIRVGVRNPEVPEAKARG